LSAGVPYELQLKTQDEHSKTRSTSDVLHDVVHRIVEHEPAFRAFLRKRLSNETIVEDVFQQCLLRAVERQHSVKNQESVVAWFYQILRNAVIDYYRSKHSEEARHQAFGKEAEVLQQREVPSLDALKGTICACLDEVVGTLRPGYGELIRRIDLGDESTAAVAKALHISTSNATVRLHRARQALRNKLEEACGVCTKHGCLNCTCS
jgi:RNA polymerase sigma-70 factor (ECF subfamily)